MNPVRIALFGIALLGPTGIALAAEISRVRENVAWMDANFDQVWAVYKYPNPKPNGEIGWHEQITHDNTPKLKVLRSLLSPSRDRYFYVERVPSFLGQTLYPKFDEGPGIDPGSTSIDWDPTKIAMRVHVHKLSGEEIANIDIPVSYLGPYGEARWLGDKWIALHDRKGKQWGNQYALFVNVETGEKQLVGWMIHDDAATSDGRYVVFTQQGTLFVNFRPVYPYLGEPIPDFGQKEGWETYVSKYVSGKEKRPYDRHGKDDLRVLDVELAPDAKTAVALAALPAAREERVDPVNSDSGFKATHIVLIDLEKTAASNNPESYSLLLPLSQPGGRYLERDDARGEFRVVGTDARTVLWRRSFAELAKP